MGLEFGEVQKEIPTLDNGKMVRQMDMVFIHGLMEIDMKDNLLIVLNMEKVFKSLQMVIVIKDFMKMASLLASVNIIGQQEAISREILKKD